LLAVPSTFHTSWQQQMSLPNKFENYDGFIIVDGTVVPQSIDDAFRFGSVLNVPFIMGNMAQETDIVALHPVAGLNDTQWHSFLRQQFRPWGDMGVSVSSLYALSQFEQDSQLAYTTMATDIRFVCSNIQLLKFLSSNTKHTAPVWYYLDTQRPTQPYPFLSLNGIDWKQSYAFHSFDLLSLTGLLSPHYSITETDRKYQELLEMIWSTFAKDGKAPWLNYRTNEPAIALISVAQNIQVVPELKEHECRFWQENGFLDYAINN